MAYSSLILAHWDEFTDLIKPKAAESSVPVDGRSLTIARVVFVARYLGRVRLSEECIPGIETSMNCLRSKMLAGETIYAVNTGVGGNSDTRTEAPVQLQKALLLHLNSGIIGSDPGLDNAGSSSVTLSTSDPELTLMDTLKNAACLHTSASFGETTMPQAWVRGALLVRGNSLASGYSGISPALLKHLFGLLHGNICPVVPLRGSISASGDLTPLSYVVGAMAGSPGIRVWQGEGAARAVVRSDEALIQMPQEPYHFQPKEVIAVVNGTAFSAAVSSLVLHQAHCYLALGQALTALAVESLQGTSESFDPLFSRVRPHPGETEVARNLRGFLQGSQLLKPNVDGPWVAGTQRQDRYSLRTAAQWIGPTMEELERAHRQIETECNATTDNPLIHAAASKILHGGNFQAMAVTAAMETVRGSLLVLGRLLFAQLTELCNPALNQGLPPNLTAEDPSRDFLAKGMDISAAAYTSELGFLAARVTPHVMSAEMHNQSVNSLALISARYAFSALDVFGSLAATCTVALCQALDLRAIHQDFLAGFEQPFATLTSDALRVVQPSWEASQIDATRLFLWHHFQAHLVRVADRDIADRFAAAAAAAAQSAALVAATGNPHAIAAPPATWIAATGTAGAALWRATRDAHAPQRTLLRLGAASRRLFAFVRLHLRVPFLRADTQHLAQYPHLLGTDATDTIGSLTSRIFDSARDGSLFVPVMAALRAAQGQETVHEPRARRSSNAHSKGANVANNADAPSHGG